MPRSAPFTLLVLLFGAGGFASDPPADKAQEAETEKASRSEPARPKAWLTWHNGDSASGHLVSIKDRRLQWKSPYAAAPLHLRLDALAAIRFADNIVLPDKKNAPRTTQVTLDNGDRITGDVVGIDDKQIVLDGARHGIVKLDRKRVVRITRGPSSVMILDGIGELRDWQPQSDRHPTSEWQFLPDGSARTAVRSAAIFRPLDLPEQSLTEINIEWTDKAAFSIGWYGVNKRNGNLFKQLAKGFGIRSPIPAPVVVPTPVLHVTVWDDEVVVESSDDFAAVQPVDHSKKRLRLRVYWDRKANKMWLMTDATKQPVEFAVPKEIRQPWVTGLRIQNLGRGLTVKSLRVVKWQGESPVGGESKQGPVVETSDGTVHESPAEEFDKKTGKFLLGNGTQLKWNDVVRIEFGRVVRAPSDDPNRQQVVYADGGRVRGELRRASDSQLWVATDYAAEPIACRIDDKLRAVTLRAKSSAPEQKPFPMVVHGASIRIGVQLAEAAGQQGIGVRSAGCDNAVLLSTREAFEVGRRDVVESTSPLTVIADGEHDLVYLDNRDVVAGTVLSIDDNLAIRTPDGTERTVPSEHVTAVSFAQTNESGGTLTQAGWETNARLPKAIREAEGRIEFFGNGSFRHANILGSNEFTFSTRKANQAFVEFEIRCFADAGDWSHTGAGVVLGFYSNQIYARSLDGEQGFSQQLNTGRAKRLKWHVQRKQDTLVLSVQGKEFFRLESDRMKGRGLAFTVRQQGAGSNLPSRPLIQLSSLTVVPPADLFAAILSRDKEVALRVPRRNRRRPPTHLLLARNGDLLRCRLEGVDDAAVRVAVRSGSRKVRRDRIAGIIRITAGAKTENASRQEPVAALPTASCRVSTASSRLNVDPKRVTADALLAHSPFLGDVSIPIAEIRLIEVGQKRRDVADAPYDPWRYTIAESPADAPSEDSSNAEAQ